jgi:UDP-GlcNAc:undecaprenyl-phosphate GlcNAc-1-phosphate transferase
MAGKGWRQLESAMTNSLLYLFLTFGLSFLITLIFVPVIRRVAFRMNVVDVPSRTEVKKIHSSTVPLLGGVAIFIGTVSSILLVADVTSFLRDCFLLSLCLLILGVVDDRKPITYKPRLFVQMVAAALMVISLKFSTFVGGNHILAILISLLWIIGITNAINLMDNIDGAATGVAGIAAASLAIVGFYQGNIPCVLFSTALLGACGAFLLFNTRPASIFLGDAGCLFIGFSLAVISIMEVVELRTTIYQYLAFPFFLGMPIFDTTFATVRRIAKGRAIYLADGSNLTYRFLEKGWDQSRIVVVQYSLQLMFSLVAFGLLFLESSLAPILLAVGLGVPILLSRYLA